MIKRDIARTFPDHSFFKDKDGIGQGTLFNVIKVLYLQVKHRHRWCMYKYVFEFHLDQKSNCNMERTVLKPVRCPLY